MKRLQYAPKSLLHSLRRRLGMSLAILEKDEHECRFEMLAWHAEIDSPARVYGSQGGKDKTCLNRFASATFQSLNRLHHHYIVATVSGVKMHTKVDCLKQVKRL